MLNKKTGREKKEERLESKVARTRPKEMKDKYYGANYIVNTNHCLKTRTQLANL